MIKKIERAIRIIKDYRDTHISWLEYFKKYPKDIKKYEKLIHSPDEQKKIIRDYNYVLCILDIFKEKGEL